MDHIFSLPPIQEKKNRYFQETKNKKKNMRYLGASFMSLVIGCAFALGVWAIIDAYDQLSSDMVPYFCIWIITCALFVWGCCFLCINKK